MIAYFSLQPQKDLINNLCSVTSYKEDVASDSSDYISRDSFFFSPGSNRVDISNFKTINEKGNEVIGGCWGNITNLQLLCQNLDKKNIKTEHTTNPAKLLWHYYRTYGINGLKRVNGLFSAFFIDFNSNSCCLISDRYGFSPLYYYALRNSILFSDKVHDIVKSGLLDCKSNYQSWVSFLYLDSILGDETFFEGIVRIAPATVITLSDHGLKKEAYWNPMDLTATCSKTKELPEEVLQLFKKSMEKLANNVDAPYVFLSGGLDSRLIAAELFNRGYEFPTYTSRKYFPSYEDKIVIEKLRNKLPVRNTFVEQEIKSVYRFELEAARRVDFHSWELAWYHNFMQILSPYLSGTHFDGLVGDVLLQKTFITKEKLNLLAQGDYKGLASSITKERGLGKFGKCLDTIVHIPGLKPKDFELRYHYLLKKIEEELRKYEGHPNQIKLFYMRNRERRSIAAYSTELLANHTPAVYPFLENEFFEFVMSIPEIIKFKTQLQKQMLEIGYPHIKNIPSTDGMSLHEKRETWLNLRSYQQSIYTYIRTAESYKFHRTVFPLLGRLFFKAIKYLDQSGILGPIIEYGMKGQEIRKTYTFPMLTTYYFCKPLIHYFEWHKLYFPDGHSDEIS